MLELHTEQLLLREWCEDDWSVVYAMSREPEITRYQSWLRLEDEARAQRWVREAIYHNQLTPRRAYNMAIVERASGVVVGWLGWGLREESEQGDFSFGYALLPSAWGLGYMTEAVQAMLAHAFDTLGATQVEADCAASNRASARVLEKAGLRFVESVEETDYEIGVTEDQRYYTITRDEWQHGRQT